MEKCFWCGALSPADEESCASCGRSLQWSSFLAAILRPSIGEILGARVGSQASAGRYNRSKYPVLAP